MLNQMIKELTKWRLFSSTPFIDFGSERPAFYQGPARVFPRQLSQKLWIELDFSDADHWLEKV